MQATGTQLKDFYQAELSALRNEAAEFAARNPEAAKALGLARGQSSDPQVEILVQSFAFLAARLQYQVRLDEAALPNALLSFLYPHLEAPTPSMCVAQIAVKPDGANFAKEQILQRNRTITAGTVNEAGNPIDCRFRTAFETPLVPMQVTDVRLLPASESALAQSEADNLRIDGEKLHSVLRLRIQSQDGTVLTPEGSARLRFFIDRNEPQGLEIYEMLATNLIGVAVHATDNASGTQALRKVSADNVRWLGFEEDEAMLVGNPQTHPGYRLLQEYFAFPDKFLFFDVQGLDLGATGDGFELYFLLSNPIDKAVRLTRDVLRLNCVPLVNLFNQRLEPIALDQTEYEYRLQGDLANHRYCEIYAIDEIKSIRPGAAPRPVVPYFAMDNFRRMHEQDYFYVTRRERSQSANVEGSEVFISLLDTKMNMELPVDEVIAGRALCTNRHLPEKLVSGSAMALEGPGPVKTIVAVTKPTAHQTPDQIGTRPWALVSQLALNHLSLTEGADALAALKDMLRLHVGSNRQSGLKQIDAIVHLACTQCMRPMARDGWRGFVRSTVVRLSMDRSQFTDSNPVLFGAVLRVFFSLYASVNSVVETCITTQDMHEAATQWQPLAGAKTNL